MDMCSKSWRGGGCASEALPGRDVCAVHAKHPNYAPATGELVEIDFDLRSPFVLDECVDDEGDCSECDGSGEHECLCGDLHDCKACSGRGKATVCRFCESTIGDDDRPTEADKRDHLEHCRGLEKFIADVAANTLTTDERKLYDRLLKAIGPEAEPDPCDSAGAAR
jgi:RecJ-like exonuclease